jgi:hypothetical protein
MSYKFIALLPDLESGEESANAGRASVRAEVYSTPRIFVRPPSRLRRLLQQRPHASFVGQGFAEFAARRARWDRCFTAHTLRAAPPVWPNSGRMRFSVGTRHRSYLLPYFFGFKWSPIARNIANAISKSTPTLNLNSNRPIRLHTSYKQFLIILRFFSDRSIRICSGFSVSISNPFSKLPQVCPSFGCLGMTNKRAQTWGRLVPIHFSKSSIWIPLHTSFKHSRSPSSSRLAASIRKVPGADCSTFMRDLQCLVLAGKKRWRSRKHRTFSTFVVDDNNVTIFRIVIHSSFSAS